MDEQLFDRRLAAWLDGGPTTAAGWVVESVVQHARSHPVGGSRRVRWGIAKNAAWRPASLAPALRPLLLIAVLVVALALAGGAYLAWRQNVVVPPLPSPSPTPPALTDRCPQGTDPDQPGPADQARPLRGLEPDWTWSSEHSGRAAVDAQSRQLVLVSEQAVWAFDLCTNTWREKASTIVDARAPVYDPVADRIVFVQSGDIATYDVDTDRVAMAGETPVVGNWKVDYDSARGVVVARDELTSRLWTYDVRTDTWREIAQAGDVPPTLGECSTLGEQVMTYDPSQDLLVLYYPDGCPGTAVPRLAGRQTWYSTPGHSITYEFDLPSASWQRQPDPAPRFGVFDWNGPLLQMAYDGAAQRSVLYAVDRLATYDAARHSWADAFVTPAERLGGDYSHYRVALAYDPVNRRTVLVGSDLLGSAGPGFHAWWMSNDVTAIDLVTGNAIELLSGRRPVQPSPVDSVPPV